MTGKLFAILAASLWAATEVAADCYMHNPPGSNDRNRERNENRNNGNRLFDSQNNDKGGYPWRGDRTVQNQADAMQYYVGSQLPLEWTNQHASGDNPTTESNVIIQYACEDTLPGLRDGYPSGALTDADDNNGDYNPPYQRAQFNNNNNDGTNRISANTATDTEYGMHEDLAFYQQSCQQTERNKGLYVADQNLNGDDATKTRQNPNGNRNGFECPEERDYYPYWLSTPWTDIAVLASNSTWCDYYEANSANTVTKYRCVGANGEAPITQEECTTQNGQWTPTETAKGKEFLCEVGPTSRQNALGNAAPMTGNPDALDLAELKGGTPASFTWSLPDVLSNTGNTELECVLRVRYNITTMDYPGRDDGEFLDSRYNCPNGQQNNDGGVAEKAGCVNTLANGNRPLYDRPYVQMFDETYPKLSIALNTDQSGRVFQDRSHVFKIVKVPDQAEGQTIWNVNTRGRRGNIVQSYPAVEYGFFPSELRAAQGDLLHFQFHGSDFNAARNPNNGDGWQYSDRFNLVQADVVGQSFPMHFEDASFFKTKAQAAEFALLDSEAVLAAAGTTCEEFENGDDNEQNDPRNCGKLNAASARWSPSDAVTDEGGPFIEVTNARSSYEFVNTRNNNFSNRSVKWMLHVTGLVWWETALIALSVVAVVFFGNMAFVCWLQRAGVDVCSGYKYYCCPCMRGRFDVEDGPVASTEMSTRYKRKTNSGKSKGGSSSRSKKSTTGSKSKKSKKDSSQGQPTIAELDPSQYDP